jgi:hypothetical protein
MARLHAGLDLSCKRLDVCLLNEQGGTVQVTEAPPDADGLRGRARQTAAFGEPVQAVTQVDERRPVVHDQLELAGWEVVIADVQKVKGLAALACKTDRIDAWVPELCRRDLVPEIWLPTQACGPSGNGPAGLASRPLAPAVGYERRAEVLLGRVRLACELICLKCLNQAMG